MAVGKETSTARRTSSRIASQPVKEKAAPAAPKRKSETPAAPAKKAKMTDKTVDDRKKAATTAGDVGESPSSGALPDGYSLPALTLKDQSGKDVNVAQLKNAVIFTYPKANTPGCTTQACLFRDEYAEFKKIGFEIYGLSNDGETSLKNWKEKKEFPYPLLSDPKRELIGALTGSKSATIRSHFVINAEGKLIHSALKVKPAESSAAALKIASKL